MCSCGSVINGDISNISIHSAPIFIHYLLLDYSAEREESTFSIFLF